MVIHCTNYDCPKWLECKWITGEIAKNCEDPKKRIVLGELPK